MEARKTFYAILESVYEIVVDNKVILEEHFIFVHFTSANASLNIAHSYMPTKMDKFAKIIQVKLKTAVFLTIINPSITYKSFS